MFVSIQGQLKGYPLRIFLRSTEIGLKKRNEENEKRMLTLCLHEQKRTDYLGKLIEYVMEKLASK